MDFKELFTPNPYFDDPKVELYAKKTGFVKKKTESLRVKMGFKTASKLFFFRYHKRGELLGIYTDTPIKGGSLSCCIVLSKIENFQINIPDKPSHFLLKLDDGQDIHLKCEAPKEKEDWVKTIKFFRSHYSENKKNYSKGLITEFDQEMKTRLAAENDLENWSRIKSRFDYTSFIKDKNLSTLFETNLTEMIKNRLIIANITKDTKHKKEEDTSQLEVDTVRTPLTPTTPNTKAINRFNITSLTGSPYYMILVSQKPINIVDEEFAQCDSVILKKDILPSWAEFNTVYFFQHSGAGDITEYKKSFKAE